jgi:hypothetical protein
LAKQEDVMSKNKKLTLRDVVGGIVNEDLLQDAGKLSFLVTFKTHAYEQGHVNWLEPKFEEWARETEQASGISTTNVTFHKASRKGGEGSIAVRMEISGTILHLPVRNTSFLGNMISTIRKNLAEIVMLSYYPEFDYKNPLFDALHIHEYVFLLGCDVWEEGKKRLERLVWDRFDLEKLLNGCGAFLKKIEYENDQLLVALRWKNHATETQRDTLEKVLRAYLTGMGLSCLSLKIQP